ncbi:MAG: recombinase family protein [Acutalibacteraceae bacterium]|nr:recombinase family protein [Acutalibacteraceae bacterium]
MKQYAMYLRKSRADTELEAQGELETLSRHEAILKSFAENHKLSIGKIYKEVVSGETISSRPVMQQLLHDVEQEMWNGVLVMEIERLARGDTIDQGLVAQTFKYSDTLIITPHKTYNPNNEFDEEYFEFGLFMSRREYKTINRRLQTGRLQSIKEGKFVGNKPPYGYKRIKLKGEKGFTLEPIPEQANVVKQIFKWYAFGDEDGNVMGFSEIGKKLHNLGVLSATGRKEWQSASIRDILSNPVYIGKVRWGLRPQKKSIIDGKRVIQRTRAISTNIYDGLHPAIIDIEIYNIVQKRKAENRKNTCPKSKSVQNPLAGLVVCAKCGKNMQRRPYTNGYRDSLICVNPYCSNVSSDLYKVELSIIESLKKWITKYEIKQLAIFDDITTDVSEYQNTLKGYTTKLENLKKQLDKVYEAYELGIYNKSAFLERSEKIKAEQILTFTMVSELQTKIDKINNSKTQYKKFIPKTKQIIDVYYELENPSDKNKMLKEILSKIEYSKEHTERSSKQYDNFKLILYPKISDNFL